MDRDGLPRLDMDGFTSENRRYEPAIKQRSNMGWKEKAADFAERMGIPVKDNGSGAVPQKEEVDLGYRRLLIKTGICAAIAVIILGISSINTPEANNVTQVISDAVNHEFTIPEDIGRLKYVDNLNDELQSVFSPMPDAAVYYPADGEVITTFGQAGSKGVRIVPVDSTISCIAKGTVRATGEINGAGYVKIELDTGEIAVFYNTEPIVKADDIVNPGQQIGSLDGDYLYLELKSGDEYIDPMEFIKKGLTGAN